MVGKNEPWRSDSWYVSPWNFVEAVTKDYKPPQHVEIHDVTLRDGEQQPGIVFTKNDKIRIAEALAEAGIRRIEAGMPAVSPEDEAAIREIVKRNLGAEIFAFCRALPDDIKRAADCGVCGVVIEAPVSQHFMEYAYGWSLDKSLDRVILATQFAKEQGLYTIFFTIDGSRADIDWYFNYVEKVAKDGYMDSLVIVDTFSGLSPTGAGYFVRKVKERINRPLEIHFHNMFGMAAANTVAAVLAGAEVIHTTVNGIGEQAGNCPMEETVMSLLVMHGIDVGIKYNSLYGLSKLVGEIAGSPANRPFVGDMTYTTEIGVGASAYRRVTKERPPFPAMVYPVVPEFVGHKPQDIVMGKKSGVDNVEIWAERLGIELTREEAREIVGHVKNKGIELRRLLTEDEFREIVQYVKANKA